MIGLTQTAPPRTLPLGAINVTGAVRLPTAHIVHMSGLTIGEPFDGAASAAVAERIGASGLFTAVSYRTSVVENRVALAIIVTEAKWTIPVEYMNYPWWSDSELTREVAAVLPTFDQTLPNSDVVFAIVARVLDGLLRARGLPGHTEHLPGFDQTNKIRRQVFFVAGISDVVRRWTFPGAAGVHDTTLQKVALPFIGHRFSRVDSADLRTASIALYRRRGFLRMEAGPLEVALVTADGQGGWNLSLPINEGRLYSWNGITWSGHTAMSAKQLEAGFKIKVAHPADGDKIDAGVKAAVALYRRQGYLDAALRIQPEFDDAAGTVRYVIEISEGRVFRLGAVYTTGLTPADSAEILRSWKPKPGQILDGVYVDGFPAELRKRFSNPFTVEVRTRPETSSADVVISPARR